METDTNKYERAIARVREIKKFYGKVVTYLVVMLLLIGYSYFVNDLRGTWFIWVAGFWGLGLILNAFKLFGPDLFLGKDWEKRKIEEEMRKEDRNSFY